jgi:CBS domain-containing protein
MTTAQDMMDTQPLQVPPTQPVRVQAARLIARSAEGACVVEGDRLLGVVTSMDLVFQQKNVHLPSLITIMDAVISLDFTGRTQQEVHKILGACVRDIMTSPALTVGPQADLADVATLMVEKRVSLVPVVDGDRLLGAITKVSVLKAALSSEG